MNNKEILKNIKITEESILTLFKENTTIELTKLLDQSLSNNIKIILQELPLLVINPDTIDILNNIILLRLKNLCRKKYITKIKLKTNTEDEWIECYTRADLTDIGNISNKEIVIRAGKDSTILYHNNKEENDIIEVTIKTEAKLNKDSFLNVDILDFTHEDYKYYNVYKVIFLINPFATLKVVTDKNHKCFQSVDIEDPYTELYKYYGMKIFVNNKKLHKFTLKGGDDSNIKTHNLTINNILGISTNINIFSNNIKKENLIYKDSLPPYSRSELDLKTMGNVDFYFYFTGHNRCVILNGGCGIYSYV